MLRRQGRSFALLAGWAFFILAVPVVNLLIVPPLAASYGHTALPCTATAQRPYAALSPIYCLLGRNYVRSEVAAMLEAMERDLSQRYPGLTVAYLDASYPFLDGFPLPPPLSHHDGRRVDLAYFYKDSVGSPMPLVTARLLGFRNAPRRRAVTLRRPDALAQFQMGHGLVPGLRPEGPGAR